MKSPNWYKIQRNIVSYLITLDKEQLVEEYLAVANLFFTEPHFEVIGSLKNYIKLKPEESFEAYVTFELDEEYLAELLSTQVSEKVYRESLKKFNDYTKDKLLKMITSKNGTVDEKIKDIKNIRLGVEKPKKLTEISESRKKDRLIETIAPSTGYPSLDKHIKGFIPGHLYTMTGQTNVGKTIVASNFAYRVAKQGKRVLYFALEPDDTIIEYFASIWTGKLFDELTPNDFDSDINIDVYTKEQVKSLDELVTIVDGSSKYDLIIIDHFGYFTTSTNNKTQQESNAVKAMIGMAKRNKCAVLIIAHPRKQVTKMNGKQKDKTFLSMDDISGSAAFKQDATEVLIIVREKDEADEFGLTFTNNGYILVAKTKSGSSGAVKVSFVDGSAQMLEGQEAESQFITNYIEPQEEVPF